MRCIGFLVPKGPGDRKVKRCFVPTRDDEGSLRPAEYEQDPNQEFVPQGTTQQVADVIKTHYGIEPQIVEDIEISGQDGSRDHDLVFVLVASPDTTVVLPCEAELLARMRQAFSQPELDRYYATIAQGLGGQTLTAHAVVDQMFEVATDAIEWIADVPGIGIVGCTEHVDKMSEYLNVLLRDSPEVARAAQIYLYELEHRLK